MKANTYTDVDVIGSLESAIKIEGSAASWANAHGFSRSFICDVLAGTRNVTERLARELGFERVSQWRKV
jgi:hypothetical protein